MLVIHGHLSFWLSLPLSTLITAVFALVIGYVYHQERRVHVHYHDNGHRYAVCRAVGNVKSLGGYTGVPNIPPPDIIHLGSLGSIVFDEKVDFFYLA